MYRLIAFLTFMFACTLSLAAFAQPKACAGPEETCAQILELQQDLAAQKEAAAADKAAALKAASDQHSTRSAQLIGAAALIAVGLKLLMSGLKSWFGYFKTDRGKAIIKVILLVLGFVTFIATNIGAGMVWWQAVIVAGGAPGAILVHELMDLIPVIGGKKPLPPDPVDPTDPPTVSVS